MNAAVDFAPQETGGFQHPEMFGDGRERHAERLRQFADRRFAACQAGQYGAACGVSKGAERAVQSGGGIVNHMV